MKPKTSMTLLAALCLAIAPSAYAQPAYGRWMPLFDGKTLAGWKTHPKQPGQWRVENGAIVGSGDAVSHLFSERGDFAGFHLRAEARINAKGNSGIYFRSEFGLSLRNAYPAGYEAQIYLGGGKEDQLTGSLYGFAPVRDKLVRPDTWFTLEIVGDGHFLAITVDGKKVVNFKDEKSTFGKGHFALQQSSGTTIAFRKIEVRESAPAPAYTVIKQGAAPTCWINASMAAVLFSGGDLSKLVQSKGKNRYAVSLYNCNDPQNRIGGGTHPIVVETEFDGKRLDADIVIKPGDQKAFWAVIVQRGVIQAVQQWDPSQSIQKPHGGGAGDALAVLTGQYPVRIAVRAADAREKIEAALSARKPVVFGMNRHTYAVLESSAQGVTLYDPYGHIRPLSWDTVVSEGNEFFIAASAVKAGVNKDRTVWAHDKGTFTKQTGKGWNEADSFHFLEKDRTQDYVELHDESRNVWVRLYDDRAEIKRNGKYVLLYQGGWKK
jgi:hypothetical protein